MDPIESEVHAAAWKYIYRQRCCPPEHVSSESIKNRELGDHLEVCHWCRQDYEEGLIPTEVQHTSAAAQPAPPDMITPGAIFSIQPSLGGWGPKKRYYNPPLIIIASFCDERAVEVFQICGEELFAGPEDVLLDGGMYGFVETWNRYTLAVADLAVCYGTVSDSLIEHIQTLPDIIQTQCEVGSLLWHFRQLEIETGYFFSRQSVQRLMQQYESSSAKEVLDIRDAGFQQRFKTGLRSLPVILSSTAQTDTFLELIAGCEPNPELLPLAADNRPAVDALLFKVSTAGVESATVIRGSLTHQERKEEHLMLSGILDIPDDIIVESYFFWKTHAGIIPAEPGQSGISEKVFWAMFPVPAEWTQNAGELVVRILVA